MSNPLFLPAYQLWPQRRTNLLKDIKSEKNLTLHFLNVFKVTVGGIEKKKKRQKLSFLPPSVWGEQVLQPLAVWTLSENRRATAKSSEEKVRIRVWPDHFKRWNPSWRIWRGDGRGLGGDRLVNPCVGYDFSEKFKKIWQMEFMRNDTAGAAEWSVYHRAGSLTVDCWRFLVLVRISQWQWSNKWSISKTFLLQSMGMQTQNFFVDL